MKLSKGDRFTSTEFPGIVTVTYVDSKNNALLVDILTSTGHTRSETWNLAHTIGLGFKKGYYNFLGKEQ